MTRDDGRPGIAASGISRRELLLGSAAAGFALAVRPVSAATITTESAGLTAGDVHIAAAERSIPAYRALPAGAGPFPTVLVVHEIFGVHEYIRDVCRRLAKAGYLAVAPYLYARQGDVTTMPDRERIIGVVAGVPDSQVLADLDATLAWARGTGKADAARAAITGFCWGGRIVWLYAAHNPGLKAGAAWYGRLAGEPTPLQPLSPIGVTGRLTVPILGLYGGADSGIPLATVERMREALKAAGSASEIIVYADAPHGFHADYRPMYREAAAEDAWKRMLAWFTRFGA
jgi:carboxymethylenebutenolidase